MLPFKHLQLCKFQTPLRVWNGVKDLITIDEALELNNFVWYDYANTTETSFL